MLYVVSATVKTNKLREYRRWLEDNLADIRQHWPEGWTLKDVYFTVFGLGGARSEIHWELESYTAFETSAEDSDPKRASLLDAWFDFFELSTLEARVLKSATASTTVLRAR
jgi:hypothetical protein